MAISGQGRRVAKRLGDKSPDGPKEGRRAQALYTPSHPTQHAGHWVDGKEKRRDEKAVQRRDFNDRAVVARGRAMGQHRRRSQMQLL
jgi:hypothetical protein